MLYGDFAQYVYASRNVTTPIVRSSTTIIFYIVITSSLTAGTSQGATPEQVNSKGKTVHAN